MTSLTPLRGRAVTAFSPLLPPLGERPALVLGASLRRTLWAGIGTAALFFGGLGTWAAWAPLASAVVAPAAVSPDGHRRTVQHLEGGIVRELLVREGSTVEAGQPLLVVESGTARASHEVLLKDFRNALAAYRRLVAERDDASDFEFPAGQLVAEDGKELREAFATQRAVFLSRRAARAQRKKVLQQRIAQLEDESRGLKAQIASQSTQLALIREEAKAVAGLVEKGFERRPRLLALLRSEAEVSGARSANQAALEKAASAIDETHAQIAAVGTEHKEEVEKQISETAASLAGIRENLAAAADVMTRNVVTAPVAGRVVEMKAHTVGGVIAAGQAILDIVPRDEELLIDARVAPTDIDEVRPGLPANVVLTAYKQRNMPRFEGKVRDVSADRIIDAETRQVYYLARVELPAAHVRALAPHVSLQPGMPVEVMVMTGEHSLLDYLLEPLLASFRRTFRDT